MPTPTRPTRPTPGAALVAALLVAAAAGCSAGGSDEGGGGTADQAPTVEQARDTYGDLADGFSAALDPFYAELDRAEPSLTALQEAAQDAGRASEDLAAGLSGAAWPEEVDPASVSAVVEDYRVYAAQWDDVAGAASLADVGALLCAMDADGAAAAENTDRLRAELGLEPTRWSADPGCAAGSTSGDRVLP